MKIIKSILLTLLVLSSSLICIFFLDSCYDDDPFILQGKTNQLSYFTFNNHKIYALNHDKLQVYNFDKGIITFSTTSVVNAFNESIFSSGSTLLLSQQGSQVYDISNPDQPEYISYFPQLNSCDPLAVKNNFLFYSVRIGNTCHVEVMNGIQVVDLGSDIPSLVKTYAIETPYAISIDENLMFVSCGENGLTIFNIEDPLNAEVIKQFPDIKGTDVAAQSGILTVTNSTGIAQYDYTNLNNLQLLSIIPVL